MRVHEYEWPAKHDMYTRTFAHTVEESKNGLSKNIHENAKNEFILKAKTINWNQYYQSNPFKESGLALYKWSPIADELKVLDKEIVLNSIKNKWNLVIEEFKKRTINFKI